MSANCEHQNKSCNQKAEDYVFVELEEKSDEKSTEVDALSRLYLMGYDKQYVLRALNVHKRSKFSSNWDISLLVEIITQLQNKDKAVKIIDEIRQNCVDNMIILCNLIRDSDTFDLLQQLSVDLHNNKEKYLTLKKISKTLCNKWNNCPSVKQTFTQVNKLIENHDSMPYFYDKISEIMDMKYKPSMDDITMHMHKRPKSFTIDEKTNYSHQKTVHYYEKSHIKLFTLPLFCSAKIGFSVEIPDIFKHRFFDPINKNAFVKKLQVSKIFNSKTKPYLIDCYVINAKKEAMLSSKYILKKGDDMRYDYCMLQLFKKMNKIWKRNGVDSHCITYECRPIGNEIGIIEMKSNCVSINKILELKKLFLKEPHKFYQLIDTAVGAFVGSYVCGVKDRHYDNVLVNTENGQLFNIDFGYVFGAQCNLNEYKIPITQELKDVFDIYEEGWHKFVWNASKAWWTLRENAKELMDYGTRLFDFDKEYKETNKIALFMTESLRLEMENTDAQKYIYDAMENSVNSWMTKMKNSWHDWEMWLQ